MATTEYASKDALLKASDLTERDVELPALKMTVRVRALPAAYSNQAASEALIAKQVGRDQITTVDKGKMEMIQVLHGLVKPKLENLQEAEQFATNCGPSFAKVIEAIDEISGVDKEAIERAEARFPGRGASENGQQLEVPDPAGEGDSRPADPA